MFNHNLLSILNFLSPESLQLSSYEALRESSIADWSGNHLTLKLPGFKKEEIDIEYKNNFLYIKAKKDDSSNESIKNKEFKFYIPDVKSENIRATLELGLLKIEFKKLDEEIKKIRID